MAPVTGEVRRLAAMFVVATRVTSARPEVDAWNKLAAWAEDTDLLKNRIAHPVFGFNNPQPEPDQPMYGYEVWMKVDADTAPGPGLELKHFSGGRYAVTTCRLYGDPNGTVPGIWQQLVEWAEEHGYRWRHTHELEHILNPDAPEQDTELELYFPIEED